MINIDFVILVVILYNVYEILYVYEKERWKLNGYWNEELKYLLILNFNRVFL